jgi:hypothetical protein
VTADAVRPPPSQLHAPCGRMRAAALSLLSVSLLPAAASATGTAGANHSLEYLLGLTKSSRPDASPPDFDCSWRRLAYAYAPHLQDVTATKAKELHDVRAPLPRLRPLLPPACLSAADEPLWPSLAWRPFAARQALELEVLCGEAFDSPAQPVQGNRVASSPGTVFVSPNGSDTNAGTLAAPLRTLASALTHTRSKGRTGPASIVLRGGTYYLGSSVVLGAADSHLSISAYQDEPAVLSGGVELTGLQWAESEKQHVHVTTLSAAQAKLLPPQGATSLRVGGQRATRARYPNANPERDLFPKGYITTHTEWVPPVFPPYNTPESKPCGTTGTLCGESKTLDIPVKGTEWHGMYQNFTVGYGGACSVYSPPVSPWCSQDFYLCRQFKGSGAMHTRMPSGMDATPHLPNAPYKHPEGAHVFAWRPGHWYHPRAITIMLGTLD